MIIFQIENLGPVVCTHLTTKIPFLDYCEYGIPSNFDLSFEMEIHSMIQFSWSTRFHQF